MSPVQSPRPPRKTRPTSPLGPVIGGVVAIAAIVGLFAFGATAENLSHRQATAAAGPASQKAQKPINREKSVSDGGPQRAAMPGLGNPVRDGKFEFVVSRVDCTRSQVGLKHLHRTADGRYCLVTLSIRNVGDRTQFFLGRSQRVFDAAGTEFTDDAVAGLFANFNAQTFLRKLDPGEKITGKLVYDIPAQTTLTEMELHDSPFSDGVRIALK